MHAQLQTEKVKVLNYYNQRNMKKYSYAYHYKQYFNFYTVICFYGSSLSYNTYSNKCLHIAMQLNHNNTEYCISAFQERVEHSSWAMNAEQKLRNSKRKQKFHIKYNLIHIRSIPIDGYDA